MNHDPRAKLSYLNKQGGSVVNNRGSSRSRVGALGLDAVLFELATEYN